MDSQAYIVLPTERFKGKLDPGDITEEEVICPRGMIGDSFIAYYSPDRSKCVCVVPTKTIANLVERKIVQEKDKTTVEATEAMVRSWAPKFNIKGTGFVSHD